MKLAVRHKGLWYSFRCSCSVPEIETSQGVVCCARCAKVLIPRVPSLLKKRRAA